MVLLPLISPWPSLASAAGIDHADVNAEPVPIHLAVRTGDDDDIDDLIVERGKKAVTERKRATNAGSGVTETEDDLYVGNKPRADNAAAPAETTATTQTTMKLPNCGTAWTGWVENLDQAPSPCPAGCEMGERQLVKTDQQSGKAVYSARYQCHKSLKTNLALSLSNKTAPLLAATCPDMARGFNHNGSDGGQYDIPQGWFYAAKVKTLQNGMTVLECNYGRHGRADLRANSHAYGVTYILKDARADRCTLQGATVTCRK